MKLDVAAFREHLGKLAEGVSDETLAQWNEACRWLAEQALAATRTPNPRRDLHLVRSA